MLEEQQLDPSRHNRKAFCSGVPALDRFLQQHAQVKLADLQPDDAKPLPPYPVPCFRLGRLARDQRWQARGIGALLLGLAVQRCLDAKRSIGGYALIVDAKGSEAEIFYQRHGFLHVQDTPRSLYLPLGD